jgi:hypothetical protein
MVQTKTPDDKGENMWLPSLMRSINAAINRNMPGARIPAPPGLMFSHSRFNSPHQKCAHTSTLTHRCIPSRALTVMVGHCWTRVAHYAHKKLVNRLEHTKALSRNRGERFTGLETVKVDLGA